MINKDISPEKRLHHTHTHALREETLYFCSRDAHRDLHSPGLRLIPSFIKWVDTSFHRTILPFTTWNLPCNSPRNLISFFTSSGFHFFRFIVLEDFCRELGFFEDSSSLLSESPFSSPDICSSCGTKPFSFTKVSIGEDDVVNGFQKSSEFVESEGSLSTKSELEIVVSSSASSSSITPSTAVWKRHTNKTFASDKNLMQIIN